MRILVIEDDPEMQRFLKENLEEQTFVVDTSGNGEDGSFKARTSEYDLIILDSILPKKTGRIICEEIRRSGKNTPILMLSIESALQKKVATLEAGADDYLTKPFSFDELFARIKALLRRPIKIEEAQLCAGDIVLNKGRQRVTRGKVKKEIYLTRKEFSLLEYLMRHKGTVVSRGMIMEHVWNSEGDPFSNTIECHILNLRKKLEANRKRKYITNVPGRGYRMVE